MPRNRRPSPRAFRSVVSALALAATVAAGLAAAPGCGAETPIPPEMALVLEVEQTAQAAYAEGRFEDAVRLYTQGAARIERDGGERVAGWRDRALYNAACSLARLGRHDEAAAMFVRAMEHGIRPARAFVPGQGWVTGGALTIEHILADPDLDRVRSVETFRKAVEPYLSAGALEIDLGAAVTGTRQPVVLMLATPESREPWGLDVPDTGVLFATLPPPVAPRGEATPPADRRWLLGDGDERWAVARIREALDDLGDDELCDLRRIHVAGFGPESGTAALHALLAMPDRAAGFAIFGAQVHPAGIADDVAALAKRSERPRIALGPGDDDLRALFASHGIATEQATDPAAAVAAWLR